MIFSLYRKPADCDRRDPFHTRQVLAARMVCQVAEALPNTEIRVAADGQYATRDMVKGLPAGANLVSRIRSDAALYALPPARRPSGRRGRYPKKGRRLPTPRRMAARRQKGWKRITLLKQGRTPARSTIGRQ